MTDADGWDNTDIPSGLFPSCYGVPTHVSGNPVWRYIRPFSVLDYNTFQVVVTGDEVVDVESAVSHLFLCERRSVMLDDVDHSLLVHEELVLVDNHNVS